MNRDLLETQWPQIRDILHDKFSNLTEEDIKQINGRYDQLVAKLQQKYGYSREEAEDRIKNWNFDRFASAPRKAAIPEDRPENIARVEKGSTFLKWLLGCCIALLLLGAYFSATKVPEVSQPPVNQQQRAMETPADRVLSNNLMSALTSQSQQRAFDMQNVLITTNNGIVTLSGTVPNRASHDFILTTAQNFSGVRQVIDNLKVK